MGAVVSKQGWKAFGNLYQSITIPFLLQVHTSVASTFKSQQVATSIIRLVIELTQVRYLLLWSRWSVQGSPAQHLEGESIIWHFLSVGSEQLMHQFFIQSLLFLTSSLYLATTPPNYGFTVVMYFTTTEVKPGLMLKSMSSLWPDPHREQQISGNGFFCIQRALSSIQKQGTRICTSAET